MTGVDAHLVLPLFVAGRDFAAQMADGLGDVAGRSIVVDATGLTSGTSSFAHELVIRLLVDGKADELVIVGAPDEFVGYARAAADDGGVGHRLQTPRHLPA